MNQTESNIKLLEELITINRNLYFWVFDEDRNLLETTCPEDWPLLSLISAVILLAPEDITDNDLPMICTGQYGLTWIIMHDSVNARIRMIGPAFIENISQNQIRHDMCMYGVPVEITQDFFREISAVPSIPIPRFMEYGQMLYLCITGKKITVPEIRFPEVHSSDTQMSEVHYPNIPYTYSDITDQHTESKSGKQSKTSAEILSSELNSRANWTIEQQLMELIENGDPDFRRKFGKLVGNGTVANLGNGDSLRHIKNTVIISTSLCMRAAVRGGLRPETAYSISDRYINSIEACTSISDVVEINAAMQEDFVERVHRLKTRAGQSARITACCDYIDLHLGEHLDVPLLAKLVSYTPNYLSKAFHEQTGITVSRYIMAHRIKAAEELLLAGEEPIGGIADKLGFGSHSSFGEHFRRETGMSPGEYRKCRGKKNYI